MCTMRAMSLRHAASDTAVRPAVLMGVQGGSAVDIVVVAHGTSSSVGRVLGTRVCRTSEVQFFRLQKLNRNTVNRVMYV